MHSEFNRYVALGPIAPLPEPSNLDLFSLACISYREAWREGIACWGFGQLAFRLSFSGLLQWGLFWSSSYLLYSESPHWRTRTMLQVRPARPEGVTTFGYASGTVQVLISPALFTCQFPWSFCSEILLVPGRHSHLSY